MIVDKEDTDAVKVRIDALEKTNTELVASINTKDWIMAEFIVSTLESLVIPLAKDL